MVKNVVASIPGANVTKKNGVGQSESTPIKNDHFRGMLRIQIAAAAAVMRQSPKWCNPDWYQYFDLYSGPGRTDYGEGSPLIFLQEVQEFDIPFRAHFFDENPQFIEQLRNEIPRHVLPMCRFHAGDNLLTCRPYLKAMNTWRGKKPRRMGLIYADPNGEPEWKILQYMSRVLYFERTDILINFGANAIKKKRGARQIDHQLTEMLSRIDKKAWSIREPVGTWQWTMLLGMNWNRSVEWKRIGFYDIKSSAGREILRRLNYSKDELAAMEAYRNYHQPGLFDIRGISASSEIPERQKAGDGSGR